MNNSRDKLSGAGLCWAPGPPPVCSDGELAVVQLFANVMINGVDHCGLPIIVTRWPGMLKTTGTWHQVGYDDVACHADIHREPHEPKPPKNDHIKRFVHLFAPSRA